MFENRVIKGFAFNFKNSYHKNKEKGRKILTNYYYSEHPDVEHQERRWNFSLLGNEFQFVTDNGVFSKRTVDFGSRTLLSALEATSKFENLQGTVLDVGCGYGPIGLAIAKRYPQLKVEMVDVNHLALDLAKENAKSNEINNVDIFASDIYAQVDKSDYQAIVSNPPIRAGKKIVHQILEGAFDHLQIGGTLTVVIQKKQGAPSAKKKMEEVFGNCEMIARNKGYQILQSQKES